MRMRRAFAWGCIESIRELGTAVGVDTADLWLASKYRSIGSDFEDNVLLAAAKRSNADFIVTWDRVLCYDAGRKGRDASRHAIGA